MDKEKWLLCPVCHNKTRINEKAATHTAATYSSIIASLLSTNELTNESTILCFRSS
ncbi:MAG: cysteine-rich KTR domain-containing protein [Lachnospiraceae bacterium]|nr:cysteine-rich KTR domain-containing protein [Lachnospiraceae bacterium]